MSVARVIKGLGTRHEALVVTFVATEWVRMFMIFISLAPYTSCLMPSASDIGVTNIVAVLFNFHEPVDDGVEKPLGPAVS